MSLPSAAAAVVPACVPPALAWASANAGPINMANKNEAAFLANFSAPSGLRACGPDTSASFSARLRLPVIGDSLPLLGLEEDLTEIGAMYKRVAHGAGLVFLNLVVRRANGRLRGHIAHGQGVALQAQQVDLAHS